MKISVVIPFYNAVLLIERCLRSILNQKGNFEREIIIVDDGSTDGSVEIINRLNIPNLILYRQSNAGPAAARNLGIQKATGQYIAFLDADDYWLPGFLDKTVAFLKDNLNAVAVSVGQMHKIPGSADSVMPLFLSASDTMYKEPMVLTDFFSFWSNFNHICTGSVLMKTDVVRQTGGQRTELRITEDLEFWAYIATFGLWGFIPEVLFVSDGGAITRKTGWLKKNKLRWASAPSVEEWEKRIRNRIDPAQVSVYAKVRGRIAKNTVYSMIMSHRIQLAYITTLKYSENFPKDKVSSLFKIGAKNIFLWYVVAKFIILREHLRNLFL